MVSEIISKILSSLWDFLKISYYTIKRLLKWFFFNVLKKNYPWSFFLYKFEQIKKLVLTKRIKYLIFGFLVRYPYIFHARKFVNYQNKSMVKEEIIKSLLILARLKIQFSSIKKYPSDLKLERTVFFYWWQRTLLLDQYIKSGWTHLTLVSQIYDDIDAESYINFQIYKKLIKTNEYFNYKYKPLFIWPIFWKLHYITYLLNLHSSLFIFPKKLTLSRDNFILVGSFINILKKISIYWHKNHFTWFWGLILKKIKSTIIPVITTVVLVLIIWDYYNIEIITFGSIWVVVGFLFFWLFSGFNFFLKRYRFGKFTSAIQRFWKRTNSYFWLVEGFLFTLFLYYYLNSSQEPLYMYDEANLNQTHLSSLVTNYFINCFIVFLVIYAFYILLNLPNWQFKQGLTHLFIITLIFIYMFLLESYQFYYVLTTFKENIWTYDTEWNVWSFESDSPRLRVKFQYLILALIAKYWHFLFIFFSWLFMFMKFYEKKKFSYALFALNFQNLFFLMGLNNIVDIYWLKWVFRRYYDIVYYWFMVDTNNLLITNFFFEINNFFFI